MPFPFGLWKLVQCESQPVQICEGSENREPGGTPHVAGSNLDGVMRVMQDDIFDGLVPLSFFV